MDSLFYRRSYMQRPNWKISLTTFNCGKALPFDQPELLSEIIKELLPKFIDDDIYVIGLQEFVPIWQGSFPSVIDPLLHLLSDKVLQYLNEQSTREYDVVTFSNTGAIALLVFTDKSLKKGPVITCNYRCGYFWSSLKGAVALCCGFEKDGISEKFTFICCHLAANKGESYKIQRVEDYKAIMSTCEEEFRFGAFKEGHIFFIGDLNFRLEGIQESNLDYTDPEVIKGLLQERDELSICRKKGLIFQDSREADITFPPTYKYLTGQSDELSDKREPAWCDRILFKEYPEDDQKVTYYASIPRSEVLQFSDHQPVCLSLQVPHIAAASSVISPRTLQSSQGSLTGDVADKIMGYGGWAITKKLHYIAILLIVVFLLSRAI